MPTTLWSQRRRRARRTALAVLEGYAHAGAWPVEDALAVVLDREPRASVRAL
jgi:hypothetical protein